MAKREESRNNAGNIRKEDLPKVKLSEDWELDFEESQ